MPPNNINKLSHIYQKKMTVNKYPKSPIYQIELSQFKIEQGQSVQVVALPPLQNGRYGFHVLFKAENYPLRQHLCFMRHIDEIPLDELPALRFAEMKFHSKPPGIQVGPWPGWRGIPEMPKIQLEIQNQIFEGRYNFWGDEFETREIRVFMLVSISDSKDRQVVLRWNDSRLAPVRLEIYPSNKIRPLPKSVQIRLELKNVHPRLLFSQQDLDALRQKKNGSGHQIWNEIENLLNNWDLPFQICTESKILPGPERLHEFDRAILSAFHALITEEISSIQRAKDAFNTLLLLSLKPDYEPMNIDTQSGECLFTLTLTFDWIYQFLSDDEKTEYLDKLFQVAERVWKHLGYVREDYGQAHFLGCSHGLLAFSLLFWDEHPKASEWASYLCGVFEYVLEMLPADGFYPHGINLWIYENAFLFRYLELFQHCCGLNYWDRTSYWENSSRFRNAALSPDQMLGITFGDPQYRVGGDAWMHYLIANRKNDVEAQALALKLANLPIDEVDFRNAPARRRVWEFLFFDSEIEPGNLSRHDIHFQDGGQFFWHKQFKEYLSENDTARRFLRQSSGQILPKQSTNKTAEIASSRKTLLAMTDQRLFRTDSKEKELTITFRAGAPLGIKRYHWGEWGGYGHSDPCQGSFLIAKGNSFLLCGPGPVYRRDTRLHNTLTFDNHGQIGDGMVWAPEFIPENRFPSVECVQKEKWEEIITNLTSCYLDFLQLKKLIRRFILLPAGAILVHDFVELNSPREVQWNLHTYGEFCKSQINNMPIFQCTDQQEKAKVVAILPKAVQWRSDWTQFVPAYPNSGKRDRFLQLFVNSQCCQFLILLIFEEIQFDYHLAFQDEQHRNWLLELKLAEEVFQIDSHP